MDAGLIWTALGTVGTCAGLVFAGRQVSLQKKTVADSARRVAGIPVAVPSGLLPANVRGRDDVLAELWCYLRKPSGNPVILAGMGGLGKSTIATAFAERAQRSRRFRHRVWWVSAADRGSLTGGLVTIARRLGANRADLDAINADNPDAPDRFWALLNRVRRRWLLVFDNADEPDVLGPMTGAGWLRFASTGMVLVTSRDSGDIWGTRVRIIRVGLLDEPHAAQLLLDRAPNAGREAEARELARRLGYLPLALRAVGSYLGSSVALVTSFRDFRLTLDDLPSSPDPRMVVTRTWEMSLDALDRSGLPQARPLLRLLSCFAPVWPIPLSLLSPEKLAVLLAPTENPHSTLHVVLSRLRDLGLIDARKDQAVELHPVLAETNRSHLTRDADAALICGAATELVVDALNRLDHERITDWRTYLLLGPHLTAMLELVVERVSRPQLDAFVNGLTMAARAFNLCGSFPAAEHLMAAALAALAKFAEDDPARLALFQDLAWPVAKNGCLAEAESMYREVLAARSRTLGDRHPETVRTRHELAWVTAAWRRWADAEAEYRVVLALRQQVLGYEHPDTLISQHELGWVLANQGRASEAEEILLQVLEIRRSVLGTEHLRTLQTQHELAWVIASQNRWDEAEPRYRRLVDLGRRILGDDHPDILTFRRELAWVHAGMGSTSVAEREYQTVLTDSIRILGELHPDAVATRDALEQLRAGRVVAARHLA